MKQALKEQIESQDVSNVDPQHNAFEVEDMLRHENFSFVFMEDIGIVNLYNTSRGRGNCSRLDKWMEIFGPDKFPFGSKSAKEYYTIMFRKALKGVDNFMFLGYVDPKTFQPLDE